MTTRSAAEGVEPGVEQGTARVWGQITVKVNLGDYNNAEVSTGHSRDCKDTDRSIARMQRKIAEANEAVIQEQIERLTALRDAL